MNKFVIYVAIHIMSMNLAAEFPATGRLAASQALSHWELLTAGRLSSLRVKMMKTFKIVRTHVSAIIGIFQTAFVIG